jgi:hypothetical protein
MDIETATTDTIEQQLLRAEATIAQLRGAQMALLREIDRRQTPTADGCRSLAEWATGRLDLAPDTAKTLVTAAYRCEWLPSVEAALANGIVSYDRVVAAARMAEPSHDDDILAKLAHLDVAGIGHLVARRRRMSKVKEREAFERRYVAAQPNLDESSWQIRGQLPAAAGRVFVEALDRKADVLPPNPARNESRSTRWADALWAISADSLAGSDGATLESSSPLLTVFIDAAAAAPTNGEAGVTIESGPQVGPAALAAVLCDGVVEVTARTSDGVPLALGRRSKVIPPRLRRAILHRDGSACTVEGCVSRYRLQIHHIVRWADGGRTDPENLTTLCWFHHQVVIHGQGFSIDPSTPPQRRRLLRPPIHAPPGRSSDSSSPGLESER